MERIKPYFILQFALTRELIGSTDLSRAILGGAAMTIPILIGIRFDLLQYCIPFTTGVLLASPSDTRGSFKLKSQGIFLSTVIATVVFFIVGYLKGSVWLLLPMIGILTFLISYLSVWGFRATLVGFSGLLSLVIALSNFTEKLPVWTAALMIGLGGLWYLFFGLIYHLIFPKSMIEESLSETIRLTAKYVNVRRKLIEPDCDRVKYLGRLIQLQNRLTESHEVLRELLFAEKRHFWKSNYISNRQLIFIQLIEILELAVSNPVDYDNADRLFKNFPGAQRDFQKLLNQMSLQLTSISKNLSKPKNIPSDRDRDLLIEEIEGHIRNLEKNLDNQFDNHLLTLKNYIKYLKQQSDKIKNIKQLLSRAGNRELRELRKKELGRFVSSTSYDWEVLIENLNFKSSIFRHSLRITVVMIIGSIVGLIADPHNYYWVLMTVIVIMRPNYGLTKTRSKQRTIGTLLGAGIALIILFSVQSLVVYGILAAVSLTLAFAMLQRNYSTAAMYITLSVVFVYALLTPDVLSVIRFRLVDTAIGAALAVAGNIWLWPAWEFKSIKNILSDSLIAQKNYLEQIAVYYNRVGELSPEYRLSRKHAFLSISELNAAFQRMTQEPEHKHKNQDEIFELVLLSHSFLVAAASLGTYTVNNPTTPASENFNSIISLILQNLLTADDLLNGKTENPVFELSADEIIRLTYGKELKDVFADERYQLSEQTLEEAHLVLGQLRWMLEISEKMLGVLKKGNFNS